MRVLVTSNFDDDSIKKERASMETPFSHYKSMGNFLVAQFVPVLVTSNFDDNSIKNE